MNLWRIVKQRHVKDVLSGEGARLYGGRWNHAGTPMVYASTSLSLAALETFVHLKHEDAHLHFVAVCLAVPDEVNITHVRMDDLPENWRAYPAPDEIKSIGTDWCSTMESCLLVVPSIIVPGEQNVLINPRHPLSPLLQSLTIQEFGFDGRLWK